MEIKQGNHFSSLDLGDLKDLMQYSFKHPLLPAPVEGKKFLRDDLSLTGMEVSLQKLAPRTPIPFYHQHKENEELYLFLKGSGEFQIDGEIVPIREGTAIRVAPSGVRTWRNTSDEPLYYIVVQAKVNSIAGSDTSDGLRVKERVSWPD